MHSVLFKSDADFDEWKYEQFSNNLSKFTKKIDAAILIPHLKSCLPDNQYVSICGTLSSASLKCYLLRTYEVRRCWIWTVFVTSVFSVVARRFHCIKNIIDAGFPSIFQTHVRNQCQNGENSIKVNQLLWKYLRRAPGWWQHLEKALLKCKYMELYNIMQYKE